MPNFTPSSNPTCDPAPTLVPNTHLTRCPSEWGLALPKCKPGLTLNFTPLFWQLSQLGPQDPLVPLQCLHVDESTSVEVLGVLQYSSPYLLCWVQSQINPFWPFLLLLIFIFCIFVTWSCIHSLLHVTAASLCCSLSQPSAHSLLSLLSFSWGQSPSFALAVTVFLFLVYL